MAVQKEVQGPKLLQRFTEVFQHTPGSTLVRRAKDTKQEENTVNIHVKVKLKREKKSKSRRKILHILR